VPHRPPRPPRPPACNATGVLPALAAPRAAAGLAVSDGNNCVLADGAGAFVTALVKLLGQGRPEIGARGRELAMERYSIDALAALLARAQALAS
jgi:hypothetical protein